MKKLLDIQPGDLLSSGIFPGLPGDAPILWKDGENVIFDSGLVRKSPGRTELATTTSRVSGLRSAQAGLERRVFVGAGDSWYRYRPADGLTTIESGLASGGRWIFTPWGTHVVANNQVDGLRYWTGTGSGAQLTTPFTFALTSFKKWGHQFAGNTDLGANMLHWSEQNDYSAWTPTLSNTAGDRELRDLNGGLVAGLDLGQIIALYTSSSLSLLSYIGGTLRFETQLNKIEGIGALSHYSIVPVGPRHYGLMRGRAFLTDGVSAQEIGEPAVLDWLENNVNWDRSSEIYGWYVARHNMVVWAVPIGVSDFRSIGYRLSNQRWHKFNDGVCAGDEGGIWQDVILGTSTKLLRADFTSKNNGSTALPSFIQTKPLDCGDRWLRKCIDKIVLDIEWSGSVQLYVGFSERPNESPVWNAPVDVALENWLPQNQVREGAEIHLKIQSTMTNADWKLNGFKIYGEVGGFVN